MGSGGLTLDSPFGADSPPRAETPPPEGVHGDIELELLALANALYNLGTTAINDNTREKPVGGPDGQRPDKKIGMRVYVILQRAIELSDTKGSNQVVEHLATIEELSQRIDIMIPMEILT
jgi:mediator of RNA polymerase II transcription subunit 10